MKAAKKIPFSSPSSWEKGGDRSKEREVKFKTGKRNLTEPLPGVETFRPICDVDIATQEARKKMKGMDRGDKIPHELGRRAVIKAVQKNIQKDKAA